jgi:uncharacterized Ntn-hydrolase superfamily protein
MWRPIREPPVRRERGYVPASLARPLGTFSIAARCSRTGMLGAAVSTAMPAAGAYVMAVRAGVGAACTQAWPDFNLGHDALRLVEQGAGAQEALDALLRRDPQPEVRQFGLVDKHGASAVHTGDDCVEWAGHITGRDYTAQGNMLVGAATVEAMSESFVQTHGEDLAERLVRALEAAQVAGGDKRGQQSAALYVVREEEWPYLSLRVDEHREPIGELRRIFEVAKRQLIPFIEQVPTRAKPDAQPDAGLLAMNLTSPGER